LPLCFYGQPKNATTVSHRGDCCGLLVTSIVVAAICRDWIKCGELAILLLIAIRQLVLQ